MPVCRQCRHEFDVGRFCTNCGHPIDAPVGDLDVWRTDTAERPATAGPREFETPPPAPVAPPPTARFPLFADEVDDAVDEGPADEVDDDAPTAERPVPVHSHRAERPWVAWAAGALALVVVAGLGAWLLLGDDSEQDLVAGEARSTQPDQKPADPKGKQARPDQPRSPKKQKPANPRPAKPTDVARLATASVPATAPPGTDFDGNVVSYEPRNMLDGVLSTCWRMPGDGTGETITLELSEKTRLRSVGLVNGYAKTATSGSGGTLDWYTGNRRVLAVEWLFDDGSVVTQDLTETRRLQTTRVGRVSTKTVELRLVTVTDPGQGPARRDYTAISDVALVGSPA